MPLSSLRTNRNWPSNRKRNIPDGGNSMTKGPVVGKNMTAAIRVIRSIKVR